MSQRNHQYATSGANPHNPSVHTVPRPTNSFPSSSSSSTTRSAPSNRSAASSPPIRILCLSDIRGDFRKLEEYVQREKADVVIHTGDFGFLERESLERMSPRILRHLLSYSPLLDEPTRKSLLELPHGPQLFQRLQSTPSDPSTFLLSQLGLLLSGAIKISVPVYTIYGPVEDVRVLEKFRTGEYAVPNGNLKILDEAMTYALEAGGVKLRLLGLGGGIIMHKMFDNGEGDGTIAGGNGTVWATALQIGELVDTAKRVYDPSETRLLVTHGAVGREGLMAQLALALKADLTISGSLHFRFVASFNEFGVHTDPESFKQKLIKSRNAFMEVYETAKAQLESGIQGEQRDYLTKALQVAQKVPNFDGGEDELAWKNCWNWNLAEAAYGHLVLKINEGRVSAETQSLGLNFAYRRFKSPNPATRAVSAAVSSPVPSSTASPAPTATATAASNYQKPQQAAQQPLTSNSRRPVQGGPSRPLQVSDNSISPKSVPQALMGPARQTGSANSSTRASGTAPTTSVANGPKSEPTRRINGVNGKESEEFASGAPQQLQKREFPQPPPVSTNSPAGGNTENTREKRERQPREPREPREPRPIRQTGSTAKTNGSKESVEGETKVEEGSNKTTAEDASAPSINRPEREQRERPERPAKNPWTLFIKGLPTPLTEDELREFWEESIRGKILRLKIPKDYGSGKTRDFAYVEFGNEEDMKAALDKHAETLKGSNPQVAISNPPSSSERPPRPSGGPRGGFSTRGGSFRGRGSIRGGLALAREVGNNKDKSESPAASSAGSGGNSSAPATSS